MWPDWASRQLEISPWTEMSVKFLASKSRIFPVNSLTVQVLRLGMRLKVNCWVIVHDSSRKNWSTVDSIPHASSSALMEPVRSAQASAQHKPSLRQYTLCITLDKTAVNCFGWQPSFST